MADWKRLHLVSFHSICMHMLFKFQTRTLTSESRVAKCRSFYFSVDHKSFRILLYYHHMLCR